MEANSMQCEIAIEMPTNPEAESKELIVDTKISNNSENIEKNIEEKVCQNENNPEIPSDNNLSSNLSNCANTESIISPNTPIQNEMTKEEVEPIDTHKLYSNIVTIRSSCILNTKENCDLCGNKESKCVLCSERICDQCLFDYIKAKPIISNSTLPNEVEETPSCNTCGSSYDLK